MPKPKKHLGQHFLTDPEVIADILEHVHLNPSDHVVEIGPGRGALTLPMLGSAHHIDAIDLHADMIKHLEKHLPPDAPITLHHASALSFDLGTLGAPLRLVGNLPYQIASPLIFHCLQWLDSLTDMHLMIQHEMAQRICARAGTSAYGRLSVMIQSVCDAAHVRFVPPEAFEPPPAVDSSVIRLTPKPKRLNTTQWSSFEAFIRCAFQHPRKTLHNNFKRHPEKLKALAHQGLPKQTRPQDLTVKQYMQLWEHFSTP